MLAKFGYVDTAWKLLTLEEYPSWGYMIQNGATTVWETEDILTHAAGSLCHGWSALPV